MGILLPHVSNRLRVGLHNNNPDDGLETLRLPKRTRRGIQPGQVHKCKSSLEDLMLPELDLPELCAYDCAGWCGNRISWVSFSFLNVFIRFSFLAVLRLFCCAWVFPSCSEQGLLSGRGACCGFSQALGRGLGSCGTWASWPSATWNLPDQGSNPHPLHWQVDGVLTSGPPGKSSYVFLFVFFLSLLQVPVIFPIKPLPICHGPLRSLCLLDLVPVLWTALSDFD